MDLKDAIYARRAVRAYKLDPIDEATIRAIIDAAIQAPSAVNEQPWSFTVVRDKALLACVSDAARAHMLATTPVGLLSHHFKYILSDPKFNIFYDAPVLIVIASKTEGPWATIDCALAAQNLILAARAAGLGTCSIGSPKAFSRRRTARLRLTCRPPTCRSRRSSSAIRSPFRPLSRAKPPRSVGVEPECVNWR